MSNKIEVSVSIILSADENNAEVLDSVASQIQHLVHEAMLAQELPPAVKYEETVIFNEDDGDDDPDLADGDGDDDDPDGPHAEQPLPVTVSVQ